MGSSTYLTDQTDARHELAATRGVLAVMHELNATLVAREGMTKE